MEKQSQMNMQNAYQMAQNQKMIKQNNSMLNRLAKIAANTELAAQYGRIAAVNTDTVAWIQQLNFLFKPICPLLSYSFFTNRFILRV